MHAEYGCGKASLWQLPFLVMYLMNATASVLSCAIAVFGSGAMLDEDRADELLQALPSFALSHGVLMLGSVVHHMPTARPHSCLLRYMRLLMALYTLTSWRHVFKHMGGEYVHAP